MVGASDAAGRATRAQPKRDPQAVTTVRTNRLHNPSARLSGSARGLARFHVSRPSCGVVFASLAAWTIVGGCGNHGLATKPPEVGVELCNDGIDNDGDGEGDCTDDDCANMSILGCELCNNCFDDDGDGLYDVDDPDCAGVSIVACDTEICDNGYDDDFDGASDCDDPDCNGAPHCTTVDGWCPGGLALDNPSFEAPVLYPGYAIDTPGWITELSLSSLILFPTEIHLPQTAPLAEPADGKQLLVVRGGYTVARLETGIQATVDTLYTMKFAMARPAHVGDPAFYIKFELGTPQSSGSNSALSSYLAGNGSWETWDVAFTTDAVEAGDTLYFRVHNEGPAYSDIYLDNLCLTAATPP